MAFGLEKKDVEKLLLETFGFDVKSKFLHEKWNDSWSNVVQAKSPERNVNLDQSKNDIEIKSFVSEKYEKSFKSEQDLEGGKVDESQKEKTIEKTSDTNKIQSDFEKIPQKFISFQRSVQYYIGRESTDRDTEKQFNSWKMIKKSFESLHQKVQSQRNHFGISPERDLDFAQASFCPTETRKCTLSLNFNNFQNLENQDTQDNNFQYGLTSAGASWDIYDSLKTVSIRSKTEAFLSTLNDYPSLFSFFRRSIEKLDLSMEPVTSIQILKTIQNPFSNDSFHVEFKNTSGFCIKKNNTCIAFATCKKDLFDSQIRLNLSEDDAVDCSHLPFIGSNFTEEDKFEFATKSGLLMFVWCDKKDYFYLASLLSLVLFEANAEDEFVSVSIACEKTLCPYLSQTLGCFRTFEIGSEIKHFKNFDIYDPSKFPPVESLLDSFKINLFRIFPSPSQILGSSLLLWIELQNEFELKKINVQKQINETTKDEDCKKMYTKSTIEDDSLTTIENSADRFNVNVDVWKGNLDSLRNQLVEDK
jgi:hypothetical protein